MNTRQTVPFLASLRYKELIDYLTLSGESSKVFAAYKGKTA